MIGSSQYFFRTRMNAQVAQELAHSERLLETHRVVPGTAMR